MAIAWLRPRPRFLVLQQREFQKPPREPEHSVSQSGTLLLTHGLAEWPPLLRSHIFGETAVLLLTFLFLACSTPAFLSSTLAVPTLMPPAVPQPPVGAAPR